VAARFSGPGQPYEGLALRKKSGPAWTGDVRFVPEHLGDPLRWKRPRRIFVNSMSDLFHERVTNEQIAAVFGVMAASPHHTFQVLTKRPTRMLEWFATGEDLSIAAGEQLAADRGWCHAHEGEAWPLPNVWLGVSAENQATADERVPLLLQTPAAVRFVSAEPLLGPIDLSLWMCGVERLQRDAYKAVPDFISYAEADAGVERFRRERGDVPVDAAIGWVIVGGESGNGARPCDVAWVRSIVEQCQVVGTACFVKQLGARPITGTTGEFRTNPITGKRQVQLVGLKTRDRKGGDMAEWPADLRVQQFPKSGHGRHEDERAKGLGT
jgi:protein gp37